MYRKWDDEPVFKYITGFEGEDIGIGAVLGLIAEGAAADVTEGSAPATAELKAVPLTAEEEVLMPAVRRLVEEHQLDPAMVRWRKTGVIP